MTNPPIPIDVEVNAFKRAKLAERLAQCTEKQQAMFDRVYPGGVEGIPEKNLTNAIDLCDRTIRKNLAPIEAAGGSKR